MGVWYKKYLQVYERPFAEAPQAVVEEVRQKIAGLQSENPVVTVSLIGYNEEKHLLACLWSLSEMQCKYPVEIIGVDNESKDRTAEIFQACGVPYYTETQHSCGFARLCGLNHARGKYHINIDSDTMYPPKYVETMVDALERPGVVGVSSLWSYIPDEEHSRWGLKLYEATRDLHLWLQSFKRPELSVRGLVFAYRTDLARKTGHHPGRGRVSGAATETVRENRFCEKTPRTCRHGVWHGGSRRIAVQQFQGSCGQRAEGARRTVHQEEGI